MAQTDTTLCLTPLPTEPTRWALDLLYRSATDPLLARDLEAADRYAHRARTRAIIGDLPQAIAALEQCLTIAARISGFAELLEASPDGRDEARKARYLDRRLEAIEGVALAVSETIALLPPSVTDADMLRGRQAYVRRVRALMPQPQRDLEGGQARLTRQRLARRRYQDRLAAVSVSYGGTTYRAREAREQLNFLPLREAVGLLEALEAALDEHAEDLTESYVAILDVERTTSRAAGFSDVFGYASARNATRSETEALALAMLDKVTRPAVEEWYGAKAARIGLTKLPHWTRHHPQCARGSASVEWSVALDAVLSALNRMAPIACTQGQALLQEGRVDARPGGADAFCHPADGRPFVRAPFRGGLRDALALAHECGHAAHQGLAWAAHGVLNADTPPPLAETTATLAEVLCLRQLLRACSADNQPALLGVAGEDAISRTLRMAAMDRFERGVLDRLDHQLLSPEDLSSIWTDAHVSVFGDSLAFGRGFGHWWMLEPLLMHKPLTARAYPLACGAAFMIERAREVRGGRGVQRLLMDLMRAGATVSFDEALSWFLADTGAEATWQSAFEDHFRFYGIVSD